MPARQAAASGHAVEVPSAARLFATLAGFGLFVYGIVGFFYDASFGSPGGVSDALGLLSVNGWANCFHLLSGAAGLLLAGFAPRRYVAWTAAIYVAVAALAT